jgi:hypothetical protein
MADEQSSLGADLLALNERISQLKRMLPAPTMAPPPPLRPKCSALATTRNVLTLFIVAAVFLLIGDVIAIFFRPDQFVFVSREGHEFQVWKDPHAYEADTGKSWMDQPPGTMELVAQFHDAGRSQALGSIGGHILFLVLSVLALRSIRGLREDASAEPAVPPERGGIT